MKWKCPVCDIYCFEEDDDYEICPVCGWENDGLQRSDHEFLGGANPLSVNEARLRYRLSKHKTIIDELNNLTANNRSKRTEIWNKYPKSVSKKPLRS